MTWYLSKDITFDSAHFLRDYNGKCANMHGHTYKVKLTIKVKELDDRGIGVDFGKMKEFLNEIKEKYDHKLLNELNEYAYENATAENMSKNIFNEAKEYFKDNENIKVYAVKVWETPTSCAKYVED